MTIIVAHKSVNPWSSQHDRRLLLQQVVHLRPAGAQSAMPLLEAWSRACDQLLADCLGLIPPPISRPLSVMLCNVAESYYWGVLSQACSLQIPTSITQFSFSLQSNTECNLGLQFASKGQSPQKLDKGYGWLRISGR